MKCIAYNGGYKYQLKETYSDVIEIWQGANEYPCSRPALRPPCPSPAVSINTEYINLDTAGNLNILKGYAWDGPSGPTIDTLTFMRGSLVHDALYQLMRGNYLDRKVYRETADRILWRICKEDGMWSARAWVVYQSVRLFADPAADPAKERPVIRAPR